MSRGRKPRPEAERFWEKVNKTDSCWLWTAACDTTGYGAFGLYGGRKQVAHRWAYEQLVGSIADGLQLDHLCRVRNCVNPSHLEPVTPAENCRRVPRPTHCPSGHEFTDENTVIRVNGEGYPARNCRACIAPKSREFRRRRRAERMASA